MSGKYDAIVIGAGLGGLGAATTLAKKGVKTLLLERHNIPGGYANSFVRGRFEFETALHELSGFAGGEKPSFLYRILQDLGILDKVEFLQIPHMYRSIFPGVDVTMPVGREAYLEKLCETFPHEKDGMARFMDRVFNLRENLAELQKANPAELQSPMELLKLPFKAPHAVRYNFTTLAQVLNRDVKDPEARGVISQYWGYFGLGPSKLSFLYFAAGLASYITYGAAFPKGRSQALSNAFIEVFEENGGEVKFSCGVKEITTKNGSVSGVITDAEEHFEADYIVSNADPITTCRDLVAEDKVPEKFFHRLQSNRIAASTFNCYMGINKSHEELGLTDHEVFINVDTDLDRHAEEMDTLEELGGIALTCYNVVSPDITPPGTSMVALTCLTHGDPWLKVKPEEYVDAKNRVAEKMLVMAEGVCPGLRDATEVIEVSTPVTNMRFAGTMAGSIYGFTNIPGENTIWRIPQKGPIRGLYFAGAWTQPGGGFEPTMISGAMAGDMIARRKNR